MDTFLALFVAIPVFLWLHKYGTGIKLSAGSFLFFNFGYPVVEELIFRGVLLELLIKKYNTRKAAINIAVSASFALLHYLISRNVQSLLVFFPSIVLGAHYIRHRNLPAVMLLHGYYNISIYMGGL